MDEWYSGSDSEEEYVPQRKNSDDEWEEVGAKQKKKKQRKEREKEAKKSTILRDSKGNPISKDKEKFLREYAQLSSNQNMFSSGTFYDHILDLDENSSNLKSKKEKGKTKTSSKKPSGSSLIKNGEFVGEEIHFDDVNLKLKESKKENKPKKNAVVSSSKGGNKKVKEIASNLHLEDIKSYLRDCEESNGNATPFKMLGDYLEKQFIPISNISSRSFLSTPEFPYSFLSSEVEKEFQTRFSGMDENVLSSNLWTLILRLFPLLNDKKSNSGKGIGLEIVIQGIIRSSPKSLIRNVQNIKDHFTKSQILTKSASPLFLWLFSQMSEPSLALSQWFQFLLPVLFDSSQAEIHSSIISFVDSLIQSRSHISMDDSSAAMAYERLMLYKASGRSIPSSLSNLLPRLMDKNFLFSGRKETPKVYFTMLLGHAATEKEALRDQVLPALVTCLSQDSTAFSIWDQVYSKYIAQSSNLLLYVSLNWDSQKLYNKISAEQLLSLSQKFVQTNKNLKKGKGKVSAETEKEIEMCNATCKLLKAKLKESVGRKSNSFICTTILPLAILVAGFLAYMTKCQDGSCSQFLPGNFDVVA